MDFSEAKSKFGMSSAFKGACDSLLHHIKSQHKLISLFDVVLIDEAQDLPQSFFEIIYHVTSQPKRIVYAYDELQNLSDNTMSGADDLFGKKGNGQPNLRIRNEAGKPRQDIVLPVCYRNTPWALTVAHGLGFGIARPAGLVQMFDGRDIWADIGYEVASGTLNPGKAVALKRKESATPQFFNELLTSNEAVVFGVFKDIDSELTWVAEQIAQDINRSELELDDILIVVPEAIAIRSIASELMAKLRKLKISSHLVGVTNSRDEVFAPNSVAITSIYRAKGNEAPMVYVVGAHHCEGGFNLAQKRNILFTAITRSRAWVRVTGVGKPMQNIAAEYQKIVSDNFELRLTYPTSTELKRITTLNKDRSTDELKALQGEIDATSRLIKRVKDGEISIESLPPELQNLVKPKK
jgi:superfamily I DNA and RNA helicase